MGACWHPTRRLHAVFQLVGCTCCFTMDNEFCHRLVWHRHGTTALFHCPRKRMQLLLRLAFPPLMSRTLARELGLNLGTNLQGTQELILIISAPQERVTRRVMIRLGL